MKTCGEDSVAQYISHSPCETGVAGSIPSFSYPSNESIHSYIAMYVHVMVLVKVCV